MLNEILILIVLFVLIYYWKIIKKLPKNLPPGPFRVPGIGNLIQLALIKKKTPYEAFHELSTKYGPITFIQVGVSYQVVLDGFDIIKEVLTDDVWVDRYCSDWMAQRSFGKSLGVLMSSGETWKEMRKFSIRTLRDFGFGKTKSMEMILEEEAMQLVKNFQERGSSTVYMKQFFTISVLNVLWNMIAGFRFSHEDKRLKELLNIIEAEVRASSLGSLSSPLLLFTAFPFLQYILPYIMPSLQASQKHTTQLHHFFRKFLNERRAEGYYREEQRDYIDVFLREIDNHQHLPPEKKFYTDEQFLVVTMDLFMAGSETTSNTIEFAILYAIRNTKAQAQVQGEIEAVVGNNRLPTISDKPNMPYTEAFILETQRMANVLPFNGRSPVREVTLGGYTIPAKTPALINLYAMHMDGKYWCDPIKFRPERFLNNKNEIINADRILPFGAGKRACLGEQLARASIFTYVATMLQKFTFELSPNHPLPEETASPGFTLSPQPYYAIVKPRQYSSI